MSSTNFAAAQERVLERRRLRDAEARSRYPGYKPTSPYNSPATFPYPLNRLSGSGLVLWRLIKRREGTRPAFRVGQVDAELLDEELLSLLKGQVGEAFKYFGTHVREDWSHEIQLALRAILFKLSIWNHDSSYGASLQNLKYTDSRSKGPVHSSPTKVQKSLYGLFTVVGRYAWDKWESWLIGQESGYDEPSHEVRVLARMTDLLSSAHSMAAFISFLVFLVNGRYRTLLDRILRIRLTPPTIQASREVSFEYLNRQLVWHAFTEFLLFLLPLVGISRWRRWLSRAWRKTVSSFQSSNNNDDDDDAQFKKKQGKLAFLPERTCAVCYEEQNPASTTEREMMAASASGGIVGSAQTDITNPYETIPCGCVYCFVCLVQKLESEEGEGWVCLRCGEIVKKCKPWSGDVLEEPRAPSSSGKVVGFAVEERDAGEEETEAEEDADADSDKAGPEKEDDTAIESSSPLEEISKDESLYHSNEWSSVGRKSDDDNGSDSVTPEE